ncbi:MAG: ATP-binding cassette subfamily C protein LapB, partial [bacterium]
SQAVALYTRYQQSKQALSSLNMIMSMEVERPDAKNFVHLPKVKGDLVFQDVSFTYPNAPLESLKGINLHIKKGEKVGIIGRTGSGKSTILRLMLNLYNPTAGSILLDGLELRQLDPVEFRKHMGYIPQNLMLFSGTLRENVLMGDPEATNERLAETCNLTTVSEFARRHPMGLDMPVGEWGGSLSGGQRQTVAIARAMLKNPDIVFMDEPTSELDNRTEELVLSGLRKEIEDKTVVIVTHKFSMLELVDRLIVMDYGRIVADGPKKKVLEQLKNRAVKGTDS